MSARGAVPWHRQDRLVGPADPARLPGLAAVTAHDTHGGETGLFIRGG